MTALAYLRWFCLCLAACLSVALMLGLLWQACCQDGPGLYWSMGIAP